jgi:GntR family transcriptional repressor for pyruvate dehydrogenase complex
VPPPGLEPINRSRLYEQVVDRLRQFIDAEKLQPGDRLMSERELAEQLGVSRTSVRQALTALKVLGFVDIRHGDGVYLLRAPGTVIVSLATEIVQSEVDHPMIWEVREGIEVQAARLAARRRTEEDVRALRSALQDMRASIDAGGDGIAGDRAFHRAVAAAAHNELLLQLTEQLADVIDRTSAAALTIAGRPPVSLVEHEGIAEAIDRCDEALASERMRLHVMSSGEGVHRTAG